MNKFYHCCSLFCLVCGKSIVVDCECCYIVIQSNKDFLALCSFNFFEKYFINMHCLITLLLTCCFMHFFYFSTCCDYLLHIIKSMCPVQGGIIKKDDIDRFSRIKIQYSKTVKASSFVVCRHTCIIHLIYYPPTDANFNH